MYEISVKTGFLRYSTKKISHERVPKFSAVIYSSFPLRMKLVGKAKKEHTIRGRNFPEKRKSRNFTILIFVKSKS